MYKCPSRLVGYLTYQYLSVNGSSTITNMEPQTHSRKLQLLDSSADLILEAEEKLHDLIQRADQDDLELALNISAFSQSQYTVSRGCGTSQLHDPASIFKPSSGPEHPELRRCQKYAELRDASQSIVEAQR